MTAPATPTVTVTALEVLRSAALDYNPEHADRLYDATLRTALAVVTALVEAPLALNGRQDIDPAWWGNWSPRSGNGSRYVHCDFCGRHGLPDGDASTVAHHADCDAAALDRARADYRNWRPAPATVTSGEGE